MTHQSFSQSKLLLNARDFEATHTEPTMERPHFHLTPPVGWMNDPNGFSIYKGEYHLFFQYYPYETKWGPMHWGHASTQDLITWKYLPCALAPDQKYDSEGCFSGSAIEYQDQQLLLYTGVSKAPDQDVTFQTQCIAVGDGIDYQKSDSNPVIAGDLLPAGSSLIDFRDPKIWKDGDLYYAVVGSRHADGSGQIALFSSADCRSWDFVSILARCENEYGRMWECPDFFSLDGKDVLLTSPQDMIAEKYKFHSGNGTLALIGNLDRSLMQLVRENAEAIDYGHDFYAPQTLLSEDGRRIMIGWLQNWDCCLTPVESSWSGMMSIPREIHIKDGKLIQNPVREIENYYKATEFNTFTLKADSPVNFFSAGRCIDLTLEINTSDCDEFTLLLAKNDRFSTRVSYDTAQNVLTFDRSESGLIRDCAMTRQLQPSDHDGVLKLRVLMDLYSIEVFVNDGEQALTSLIFTPLEAEDIQLSLTQGSAPVIVTLHSMTK
ncbi:MAG: glycoside hydrolase family 32 protein [Clostridia bacterium]|nr:glycoside hydrolase family 32 protein [Clostridia bacterium]